ncbi:MAG: FAD-dependent oxidoreductase [Armatimonadota bacterium]|nr:FAD-dependent oxidoreductase [Armatimonadota bacterium]
MTRRSLEAEVVVAGGGLAGVCAAISAARSGADVILIQDRPMLGGNTSSEVRVHATGADCSGGRPHAREGGILEEIRLEEAVRNPQHSNSMWDMILEEWVRREENVRLFLNASVVSAAMTSDRCIGSVTCSRPWTEEELSVCGEIFVDCTGDGNLGAEAGADSRIGREGPEEFDEPHAEGPDEKTMGCSLMWIAEDMGHPVQFTPPSWARKFESDEDLPFRGHGEIRHGHWWVEWGGELDMIKDQDRIRQELLACLFGVWDHIKNRGDHGAENWALRWFGVLPAKRESRRLMGPMILTENHILEQTVFPDRVAHGGWSIDTHPPKGIYSPERPSRHVQFEDVYSIPLRSLYSRNVHNLLMAGRCASCTHMAMASTRVAATGAAMGQAVGVAAARCIDYLCLPGDLDEADVGSIQQQLLREDHFIPELGNEDPDDVARQATVSASSHEAGREPTKIVSGITRHRHGDEHQWTSAPGRDLPEHVELRWDAPRELSQVQITFDSGFERPLTLTHSDAFNERIIRGPQPECVRDYRLEVERHEGWVPVAHVSGNYQRRRVHDFECVMASAVRITCEATNGDDQARIFELRAYA